MTNLELYKKLRSIVEDEEELSGPMPEILRELGLELGPEIVARSAVQATKHNILKRMEDFSKSTVPTGAPMDDWHHMSTAPQDERVALFIDMAKPHKSGAFIGQASPHPHGLAWLAWDINKLKWSVATHWKDFEPPVEKAGAVDAARP